MTDPLRRTVLVRVMGADICRFLRLCAASGISPGDVRELDPITVKLRLPAGDVPAAERIARRLGCEMTVISFGGTERLRRRLRRRGWLFLAALALMLALAASSLFVWDVSVTENDSDIPDETILWTLREQGVGTGSFWPAFRQERIRTRALLSLPELSYLAVNIRAGRAEVIARGAVEAPEIFDSARPGNITAAAAGVIESVTVLEGESAVKRGEAVSPGQTLIAGTSAAPHARGLVRAYTWHELTVWAPAESLKKEYSDGEKRRFGIIFGTKRINFYGDSGILPDNCDKMTVIRPLAVKNAFTLPVKWVTEILRSYTVQRTQIDAQVLRSALESELTDRLARQLGDAGEILRTHFTCQDSGGALIVTLRAECLERIDRDETAQEK